MKIRRFLEHFSKKTVYEVDWKKFLPSKIVVIKGDVTDMEGNILDKDKKPLPIKLEYVLGNIMSDLVYQITYEKKFEVNSIPDTLEIDVSILRNENLNNFELNVEICFGDFIASGFNIKSPNKVIPYLYTSYHSKLDPSDTVFAFDEISLKKLVSFFNNFHSVSVSREDFNFLDVDRWSYIPE